MGIATQLLGLTPRAQEGRGPLSDWWYKSLAAWWGRGVMAEPEAAMRISTVWGCVRLISETVAMLPLILYQERADGGRDRATDDPRYRLLHRRPNPRQTAMEFRSQMTAAMVLRGTAYALKVPGRNQSVAALEPIHPDRVTPERMQNGGWRYRVTQPNGTADFVSEGQMFRVMGLSLDGVTGLSVIEYAAQSLGIALASEAYEGAFYRNGSRPGGVLSTDGKLTKEQREATRGEWKRVHQGGGEGQWHEVAVLEGGLQYKVVGMNHHDMQFVESRKWRAEDIARWFRVPLHKLQLLEKATYNNVHLLGSEFLSDTLLPWLNRWEQAAELHLLPEDSTLYWEHLVEGLLRADIKTRYDAYKTAILTGFQDRNEVRLRENLNPREGLSELLVPMNMRGLNEPAPERPQPRNRAPQAQTEPEAAAGDNPLLQRYALAAARRVVVREVRALSKMAPALEGDAWERAVQDWYGRHGDYVAEAMHVPALAAERWAAEQADLVLTQGLAALTEQQEARAADLARIAMEGVNHADGNGTVALPG